MMLGTTNINFTNLLTRYIEAHVEEILGEYQCGFQKGRSTIDQIFCLRMILERACEYKVDIHQLYIDYKQAYDTINRVWNTNEVGKIGQKDLSKYK